MATPRWILLTWAVCLAGTQAGCQTKDGVETQAGSVSGPTGTAVLMPPQVPAGVPASAPPPPPPLVVQPVGPEPSSRPVPAAIPSAPVPSETEKAGDESLRGPAAELGKAAVAPSLKEQRELLIQAIARVHRPTAAQLAEVRRIIMASPVMGQGNPKVTEHPLTTNACEAIRQEAGVKDENPVFEQICGGKFRAPLYSPSAGQQPKDAKACIDQYEFPNIPCGYPVVWVKAKEAAQLCSALGERLCDAHEWEGACEGDVTAPDYQFEAVEGLAPEDAIHKMRRDHNAKFAKTKSWAYGKQYEKGVCAADSVKSPDCDGGNWAKCGSNTYPSGAFPKCRSTLDVYDQHGNAAEHMNLPLSEAEMTSRGSKTLGYTEMKGSWFIFDKYHAHEDWCRWRAPFWHGSRVLDDHSHANYHLGFRCCSDVETK